MLGFRVNEHYFRIALLKFVKDQSAPVRVFWDTFEKVAKENFFRRIDVYDVTFRDPPDFYQAILRTYQQCFDASGRLRPSGVRLNHAEYMAFLMDNQGDTTDDEDSEDDLGS